MDLDQSVQAKIKLRLIKQKKYELPVNLNNCGLNTLINTAGVWGGRNPSQYLGARGILPPILMVL